MKRYIKSSELPPGYLKTNQFNSSISNVNVLEAIEIAIAAKFDQFDAMMGRQMYLTSDTTWTGKVTEYPEGYYVELEATRSGFQAFVSGPDVIRKPSKLSDPIGVYSVEGNAGHVRYIGPRKDVVKKVKPWSVSEANRAEKISSIVVDYLNRGPEWGYYYDVDGQEVYSVPLGDYGYREDKEANISRMYVVYAQNYDENDRRVKKGSQVPGTVHYSVGLDGEILDENVIGYKTFEDAKHALEIELDRLKKENQK